jgi:hypothetical protein
MKKATMILLRVIVGFVTFVSLETVVVVWAQFRYDATGRGDDFTFVWDLFIFLDTAPVCLGLAVLAGTFAIRDFTVFLVFLAAIAAFWAALILWGKLPVKAASVGGLVRFHHLQNAVLS